MEIMLKSGNSLDLNRDILECKCACVMTIGTVLNHLNRDILECKFLCTISFN